MLRAAHVRAVLLGASAVWCGTHAAAVGGQAPGRDPAAPRVETSSISGIVVLDGPSAAPVRRATVTVSSREPALALTAVTDDQGRFRAAPLPAGRFTASAAKAGYVPTTSVSALASTITVAEGQHVSNVTVRLARGAVITGRVLDQYGLPVVSAGVTVAELRRVGRQTTTRPVRTAGPGGIRTDDRGVYRAFGLPPGSYVVAVTPGSPIGATLATAAELQWARQGRGAAGAAAPPPGSTVTYAPVYFPGTANLGEATALTIGAGEERTGVDVTLSLVPTTEVAGRVAWEDGQPVGGVQFWVVPRERPVVATGLPSMNRVAPSGPDGRFTVTGLVPGTYTLLARASPPGQTGPRRNDMTVTTAPGGGRGMVLSPTAPAAYWALAEIHAAGQRVDDLALVLRAGLRVRGRLRFENGTAEPPSAADLGRALISMASAPDAPITLRVSARGAQPDGTFTVEGLVPGEYVVTASLPAAPGASPWVLKSVTAGERDVLDAPLDVRPDADIGDLTVTFTDRITELSGQVTDQAGRAVPEFFVVVFSTEPTHWRQGSRRLAPPRRPAPDGRYTFTRLPPGEYYVAVVPEFEQSIWYTPEYLEQVVPGAIKVTIGEGEKKAQDITLELN
jgi:hypothetical protein